MVLPSYLNKGDTVAIIATARKVSKEEIQPAVAFFESYGLSVVLGKNLFESNKSITLGVSDIEIKGILCIILNMCE